ncbi:enoyl-CoA hydratase [Lyophyllum atratum]|nr:enoyl-CoA hydratase [Lyophyllum atratum]
MSHYICRSLYNPLRTASLARPQLFKLSPRTIRLMSTSEYNYILTSRPEPAVALITLNRPKALNALCSPLFAELNQALREADADSTVSAIVLTGSERAFAGSTNPPNSRSSKLFAVAQAYKNRFLEDWAEMTRIRKPIIAAVSGYALGGGCELALMCDIILASPTAKFGQPEINLGTIPGGGGSQRLAHVIGKSRTMEMVLTGRMISAQEASDWGIVSRVVKEGEGEVVKEAISVGKEIASKSQISIQAAKEVVNAAYELNLAEGLRFERRIFHSLFATKDQKEGMGAFAQKRKPNFVNE